MTRVILSIWIYIGSLIAALASASMISHLLAAYPTDHFRTFGTTIPAVSESYAQWLPYSPAALGLTSLISVAVSIYFWLSNRPREVKAFAVTLAAAINFCLALVCIMSLLVAYFLLPKLANGT